MVANPTPRLDASNNPGGARWCDDHKRLECRKKGRRSADGICHAWAIRGTDACYMHGGHSGPVAKAKGQARITAWSAIGQPTTGEAIDSSAAVMGMLQQSWLRASAYSKLLHAQVTKDGTGEAEVEAGEAGSTTGLIGYRFGAAGKDGTIYAVSEEARALVALEAQERDRVVKYAKTAHDMGISDRMTAMAERWGDAVVNRVILIVQGLNLTAEQEAMVPPLIQTHLASIELGSGQ